MSWIAYVGPFPFPWGQAGSRRMYGVARSLAAAGHTVVVGSGDSEPRSEVLLERTEHQGSIRYIGLGESPAADASIVEKTIRIFWFWGLRTVEWLDAQPVKPSHIIVYGGSAPYMLRLLPWCRKNGVRIIADVVEWYDPRQMTGGVLGPFNISAKIALRYLYPKCDGIVAISSLLANHYGSLGCPVIRVPPTLDVYGSVPGDRGSSDDPDTLTLVYAGTPGKKDLLGNVIAGVARVDPLGSRLKLLVIGPSIEQVRGLLAGQEIPPAVHVLGKVAQSEVTQYVRASDFSVLLREPQYFANAGFPTKFVESMACGVPVIANLTSDLGLYLHDGVEGLVCKDHSVDAFSVALGKALNLSVEQLVAMRVAARQQAERSFDSSVYSESLSAFMERI